MTAGVEAIECHSIFYYDYRQLTFRVRSGAQVLGGISNTQTGDPYHSLYSHTNLGALLLMEEDVERHTEGKIFKKKKATMDTYWVPGVNNL